MGGEHVSALIDLDANRLLGSCCMLLECSEIEMPSHGAALKSAIVFLHQQASDLLIHDVVLPDMVQDHGDDQGVTVLTEDKGAIIDGYSLGDVSLLWIDRHIERIKAGSVKETMGVKVKCQYIGDCGANISETHFSDIT